MGPLGTCSWPSGVLWIFGRVAVVEIELGYTAIMVARKELHSGDMLHEPAPPCQGQAVQVKD